MSARLLWCWLAFAARGHASWPGPRLPIEGGLHASAALDAAAETGAGGLRPFEDAPEPAPPRPTAEDLDPRRIDVYVFHPGMSAADYDIADQDVADLDGEALFLCFQVLYPEIPLGHNYTRISRYSLLVSPAFGNYSECNGYPDADPPVSCSGGDARLVGREKPFIGGPGGVIFSCADKKSANCSWYSLPQAGRCSTGQPPSKAPQHEGCTWSVQKRLKTVDQGCLLKEQRLRDKCVADLRASAGAGFPRSARALALAFASESVSTGGCPDIGGPPQEEATVIV